MGSKIRMVYPYPGKRRPQNPDQVTFKKYEEFKLKDRVREGKNFKQTPCLFEMSLVFQCLKETNFNDALCGDEVLKFNNCYKNAVAEQRIVRQRKMNPGKSYGSKDLLHSEINHIFRQYKIR